MNFNEPMTDINNIIANYFLLSNEDFWENFVLDKNKVRQGGDFQAIIMIIIMGWFPGPYSTSNT